MKSVVSVFDTAAQTFGQPFFVPANQAAIRAFTDEINRPGTEQNPNMLYSHPDDHELYHLTDFDDATGNFHLNTPTLLVRGKDVTKRTDTPFPNLAKG